MMKGGEECLLSGERGPCFKNTNTRNEWQYN